MFLIEASPARLARQGGLRVFVPGLDKFDLVEPVPRNVKRVSSPARYLRSLLKPSPLSPLPRFSSPVRFTSGKPRKWVTMNQDTRKLQRPSDEVKEEFLVFVPQTPRFAFPEEENDSLKKIAKLEVPADYSRLGLVPRRADLDMNQHVNNVNYIGWVLESMPQEIIDTHELQTITLDYRRECQHGDMVDSLTSSDSEGNLRSKSTNHPSNQKHNHGRGHLHFMHFLRLSGTGLEINRGRTIWRKLIR